MAQVTQVPVPERSFLEESARQGGVYTDCFAVDVAQQVSLPAFVAGFYTTPLFRAERLVLRLFARAPSTDEEARQLGQGQRDSFAVWRVEQRANNQLLLNAGRTSSFLMVAPGRPPETVGTTLIFGSVVLPVTDRRTGTKKMGFGFAALLGAHRLYSRLLLSAARRRLLKAQNP